MVHQPGKSRASAIVPNAYNLSVAAGANYESMISDVKTLIEMEGAEARIVTQLPRVGYALLHCDADFAEKVKTLPSVGGVNPERRLHAQKKAGGPSLVRRY